MADNVAHEPVLLAGRAGPSHDPAGVGVDGQGGVHERAARQAETCCRLEDFDGFLKLTVLALEFAQLPCGIGRDPVTLAGVDLGLVDPPAQRFVGHPQPLGHRADTGRAGVVLLGMVDDQPHRPGLELVVVPLRHDANNLPRKKVCTKPGAVHVSLDV